MFACARHFYYFLPPWFSFSFHFFIFLLIIPFCKCEMANFMKTDESKNRQLYVCCYCLNFHFLSVICSSRFSLLSEKVWSFLYRIQNEDPKYLFPRGNKPLLYHQIGNISLYFHYKSVKLDVLCRQNKIWTIEHLAILSNLKRCQFAPKIVIFILGICWIRGFEGFADYFA